MALRRIPLNGAVNFRDLGGYPVAGGRQTRWQRLYRSDSLAELDADDLARLQALGLRSLCDFRLPEEAAKKPNRLPDGHAIQLHAIGFIPEGTLDMLASVGDGRLPAAEIEAEVLRHYGKFIHDHQTEYRRFFELLLDDANLPLLVHCTSGKDRTGIAAALALLALGVPRAEVVRDYTLTNDYRRDIAHLFTGAVDRGALQVLTTANPRYIERALDELDSAYGGIAGWFDTVGLGRAALDDLRARLTE
ncbi:MAG: tyrosine-protein phosphatase [Pararhodobacter sp.]|nr:tyrosine-protein phosphatase [Pararhodobacter sp.]